MKQQRHRWFWISLLSLSLLLFADRSLAHNNFPTLNNSHLDGKVANLEINLRQLQREVGQLRLSLQLPQASQPNPSSPKLPSPIPRQSESITDPQLQNLGNLIIELKQDIRAIESRLDKLEPQL